MPIRAATPYRKGGRSSRFRTTSSTDTGDRTDLTQSTCNVKLRKNAMSTDFNGIDAEALEQKTPQQSDSSADLKADSSSTSEDDSQELLG